MSDIGETAIAPPQTGDHPMTLQDQLDQFRHKFETELAPKEVVDIIHAGIDGVIASGITARALKAGDRAPVFTLPDADGHAVSSAALLAKGPLVPTFYRGVWCPYCNLDLKAIEAAAEATRVAGASLVAISPQTAANSRKAARDNGLSFPILSDHLLKVAEQFGLVFQMTGAFRDVHAKLGVDLPAFNDDPSWRLPMPARYVIGQDGNIAYAEVNPDYTRRPEPSELLPVLARLAALRPS